MSVMRARTVVGVLLVLISVHCAYTEAQKIIQNKQECQKYFKSSPVVSVNATASPIKQTILLWQGIVLLICFGAFALFVVLIHRIIRTYIYYDAHLLDTFFDGGGDVNVGLIACAVVARWTWVSSVGQSSAMTNSFGLVGHFWYAAGGTIQLLLFAIVVAEIRIKAPGAKTFLQVIKHRHGVVAHIVMMLFALLANMLIAGMVMVEGVNVLTALTQDLNQYVACIVIAVVIGFFTVVGGVGGGLYVCYFACALTFAVILAFFAEVFYNPLGRDHVLFNNATFGNPMRMYDTLTCGKAQAANDGLSILTFLSRDGMVFGILFILSSFSGIFVNQSFWQVGIAAKPGHGVWGFLTGGLVWFAVPFCASFALGLSYWILSIQNGGELLGESDIKKGLIPAYVSQRLLGNTGDFLMYTFTMVAVITTVSGEVLSASAICVYDIYQTYVSPFRATPIPETKQATLTMQKNMRNEEYLEYDRRCVVIKHVIVVFITFLLIPVTLVLLAIGVWIPWLYMFTAILVGSCVIPIALAVTWHRVTGPGVATGALGGFIVAFIAWLVMASTFPGGLRDFQKNTGREEAMLIGTASAIGVGGLLCVVVSLACGGCDPDLMEEEEWEKTRDIDNPIIPWSVKYAPDIGAKTLSKGKPHFYTVRRTFKSSEICAYIFGVLMAVCGVLVWPAAMLTADIFSKNMFQAWLLVVLIWTAIAAAYIILVPLIWEIAQTCRQAYYNRMWRSAEHRERLEEDHNAYTEPEPTKDFESDKDSKSELYSTTGRDSGLESTSNRKEKWKTFIDMND